MEHHLMCRFSQENGTPRTMMEPLVKMGYSIMTPDGTSNI
jgi:hypothetical protein